MKTAKPYSVLLLYPDYLSDGPETFYGFVRACSPSEAVDKARLQAARHARHGDDVDRDDLRELARGFRVELVIRSHRKDFSRQGAKAPRPH